MNDSIVLDTHVLLWSLLSPEKLSNNIKNLIEVAQNTNNLFISCITLWEISMLIQKGRIDIYEPIDSFLNSIAKTDGLRVVSITPVIAAQSVSLPGGFVGDPADCIIIASTRDIAGTLATYDNKIVSWARLGYLKTITD